jgi:hypothetical protein
MAQSAAPLSRRESQPFFWLGSAYRLGLQRGAAENEVFAVGLGLGYLGSYQFMELLRSEWLVQLRHR